MSPNSSVRSRIWKAGFGFVAVGALATACATGTRAAAPGSAASIPIQAGPVTAPGAPSSAANSATAPGKPVAPAAGTPADPAAGAAQDPQATADIQAADQSLSQIETDLSNIDQAAASGENDVPSN